MHPRHDPPLGEIYVVAVDPDFHGLGLGRALTVAGLESLSERGLRMGMLYVDATNAAARAVYDSLGFVLDHVDRAYRGEVSAGPPGPGRSLPDADSDRPADPEGDRGRQRGDQ
ncbi:MAG: GNAT family N-acetyltransferase [Acidimicrobiales bacterium]